VILEGKFDLLSLDMVFSFGVNNLHVQTKWLLVWHYCWPCWQCNNPHWISI